MDWANTELKYWELVHRCNRGAPASAHPERYTLLYKSIHGVSLGLNSAAPILPADKVNECLIPQPHIMSSVNQGKTRSCEWACIAEQDSERGKSLEEYLTRPSVLTTIYHKHRSEPIQLANFHPHEPMASSGTADHFRCAPKRFRAQQVYLSDSG